MRVPYEEPLDMLKLPPRKQNALEELGIFTWGDLLHRLLADSRAVRSILWGKDEWWEGCEWWQETRHGRGNATFFEG